MHTQERKTKTSDMFLNTVIDNCGGVAVVTYHNKMDPSFKFYSQLPLMINSNDDIDKGCANGTLGLYFTSILLTRCKHILLLDLINTIEISVWTVPSTVALQGINIYTTASHTVTCTVRYRC